VENASNLQSAYCREYGALQNSYQTTRQQENGSNHQARGS
jgi:hypothetical protein